MLLVFRGIAPPPGGPEAATPMTTATAVLATVEKISRLPRNQARLGASQIAILGDFSSDFRIRLLAQGVVWAEYTARTTGTLSIALRDATPWQAARLVAAMASDGLELQSEVPAWLNANGLRVLA